MVLVVSDVVPGMAEAIERRMIERGLSPSQFAAAAGVTYQGLLPLRRGERKRYQTKLKLGAARALGWPADAVDRLLAGEVPGEVDENDPELAERVSQMESRLQRVETAVDELLRRADPTAPPAP